MTVTVHGTSVAFGTRAVLLRGTPGAGKSDLAFRLIKSDPAGTTRLVADDQVRVAADAGAAVASAPAALAGSLELRGLGIVAVPAVAAAPLVLIVDLVPRDEVERIPQPRFETLAGIELPLIRLHAFDATAPDKVRLAADIVARGGFPGDDGRLG